MAMDDLTRFSKLLGIPRLISWCHGVMSYGEMEVRMQLYGVSVWESTVN